MSAQGWQLIHWYNVYEMFESKINFESAVILL